MKLLLLQNFSWKVQHMQSESIAVFWKIVTSILGHCSFVSYRSLNSNIAEYFPSLGGYHPLVLHVLKKAVNVPSIILIAFPRRTSKK